MSAGAQKRWKTEGSGSTLPQYLPNPKSKLRIKFIFAESILALLATEKKAKTLSLKVFEIMDFKNLQQETTKSTLRT